MATTTALVAGLTAAVVLVVGWPHESPASETQGSRPVPARGQRRRTPLVPLGILALASVLVAGVVPSVLVGALMVVARWRHRRAQETRRRRDLDEAMPELIDLLVIAASAGQTVPAMVESVSHRAPRPLRPALAECRGRIAGGDSVAGALAGAAPGLGELGPALVRGLVTGMSTGSPLVPALTRLAETARDRRRREAEAAARRLPVALLFPLVCCILPAFALLAVVPLLAASLGSLQV